MSQIPKPYDRVNPFGSASSNNPSNPIQGTKLDAEFNAIEVSLDQTQARLAEIQRDDGALANASVGADQMTLDLLTMLTGGFYPRGAWQANTSYAVGDAVNHDGLMWAAVVAHVSSGNFTADQNAGKWMSIAQFVVASAIPITPVPNLPATTVQGALDAMGDTTDPLKGAAVLGRGVVAVDGIKALLSQANRTDLRFQVRGYHAGSLLGGGTFYWDATRARTAHNGGTIISPTVPWSGSTATLAAFLVGSGETSPAALGCFVRTVTPDSVDCFGAVGDAFDDIASFVACDTAGYSILLTRPVYTISSLVSTTAKAFELSSNVFSRLNVTVKVGVYNKTRLNLKGVDYDFTSQPSTETTGVFVQSCADLDITANRLRNPWKTAITVWDSAGGQIYRNRIFNTGRGLQYNGIVPLGCGVIVYGSSDITVDHNWLKDIWQVPVFVTGNIGHLTHDIIVSNNMCRSSNDNGIRVQPDDAAHTSVYDVMVQGNIVTGAFRADCIRASGVRVHTLGNKVSGADSTGIDAQYSTDSLIAENIINGCSEGIALTGYEVVTDNVSILNNQIIDCTGNTAAITIQNDAASGGSFRSIRIAGNKITKRAGVTGTTRGITVAMITSTGLEKVTIEDNEIDGYSSFGISCNKLGSLTVSGNSVGGVITSSAGHIQAVDCANLTLSGNRDRGVEAIPPTQAIRVAGATNSLVAVNNIMPNAALGLGIVNAPTVLYRKGNYFVGGTPAAYTFTGVGGELRTLSNTATNAQIVNFLYTLLDDLGNDRYAHR
ncbi:carbohydrate-binding protein [Pseudomonas sp. BF-R-21]|uniref:carbohydrate-binding protein n=1 Tax=Pseudomonas sp. BF-R-21 TaxID=2832387 RepID=UPI001CBFB6DB|nr:right-handed parallel beta-helix repeat-containing protein [Pseudomonas sp. BF-R-21]